MIKGKWRVRSLYRFLIIIRDGFFTVYCVMYVLRICVIFCVHYFSCLIVPALSVLFLYHVTCSLY